MHPEFEELDSQDAIASSVEHLVPLKDDPCTPAFTYPLGLLWHRIFPKHAFWNPGPFNVKEHVVIYITFFHALAFVIVTQFTGFGFAGLCRRFLVKPRAIIWPTTFSTLAIFASFHGIFGADSAIGSRASVSDPEKPKGSMVESESNSDDTTFDVVVEDETGVGVSAGSSLTADAIFLQASIPRTWGLNTIMSQDSINPILNSVKLFVGNASSVTHKMGAPVNPAFFYNATDNYNLNVTAYQDVSPIHITSFFAVQYASSFLTIAAVLSHVWLWYGSTIRRQVKNALQQASDSVDSLDVHNKLMTAYWEPSDWMFLVFVVVMAAFTFCVSLFTPFVMPWWGVFLNLAVIGILIVPCGIIQGDN
ncbi:hypothetical protein HDU79_002189 [Rhizoclosmatium sp. JEL0117]|nr:hypothetical protein HDU79_002189 [Rhizoclosmatium sp. JEL0117]